MKKMIYSYISTLFFLFFLSGCELWITPLEDAETGKSLVHVDTNSSAGVTGSYGITLENIPNSIPLKDIRLEIEGAGKENFISRFERDGTTVNISLVPKKDFTVATTTTFDFNATIYVLDKPSCSKEISITLEGTIDTIAPIIRLNGGNISVKEGTLYIDAGATAYDNKDGNISNNIVVNNPVNTAKSGVYIVTYNVIDNAGNKASTVSRIVTVLNINHAPTIEGTPITSIKEDTPYSFTPSTADIDGDTLQFSIKNKPTWLNFDKNTGRLFGTATNADIGTTTGIKISVSDGIFTQSLPVFNLDVVNVNDAPSAIGQSYTMNEDTNLNITLQATDVDSNLSALRYSIIDFPTNGSINIIGNSVVYSPATDYFGTDGFSFIVTDEYNASSDIVNINININDVFDNTIPVAKDLNQSMDVNISSITFNLIGSDADGDTLRYDIVSDVGFGVLNITNSTGLVTYDRGTYTGNASFTYRVYDGTDYSDIAKVVIKSNIPNTPPIAVDQSISLDATGTPNISLVANDVDISDSLTYRIVKTPSYGTVNITNNIVKYTPNTNFTGTDSFTFIANDGTDDSNIGYVYLRVGAINTSAYVFGWCNNNDTELWSTDGTQVNTGLLKDINPSGNSFPREVMDVNKTYYFAAKDNIHGFELWKSEGTSGSTVMVKDINPGIKSSQPYGFIDVNGTLFFAAKDGIHNSELWKSDGTTIGTVMVKDISKKGASNPQNFTNVNGVLYFTATNGQNGIELWRSDGTDAGTKQVMDINTNGSSRPKDLTNINGILYFSAYDKNRGRELWYYDTTVSDIASGYTNRGFFDLFGGANSSAPQNLFNYNGSLVFSANDGRYGIELWKRSGKTRVSLVENFAGTGNFQDADASPHGFSVLGSRLYFSATEVLNGDNLRFLDGLAGSKISNVLYTDSGGNDYLIGAPQHLTNVNGRLFFNTHQLATSQNGQVVDDYIYLWSRGGSTTHFDAGLKNRKSVYTYKVLNKELLFRTTTNNNNEELWISNIGAKPTKLADGCGL